MKTAIVIAGPAPSWVLDQTRYAAHQLTEDGRVMVAITDQSGADVQLPGDVGGSTLLGIAATGYPVWTGRASSALGIRRRRDRTIIVLFDEIRPVAALLASAVSRLRRERLAIHDLTLPSTRHPWRRRTVLGLIARMSQSVVSSTTPVSTSDRAVAYAVCDGDRDFTHLLLSATRAMAAETAAGWRIIVQSTDVAIERLVERSDRSELLSCDHGPVAEDLLRLCDVVIVRYGDDVHHADRAIAAGAAAVIVGHPMSGRVSRRFDGAWLARADASSILVAIESARGSVYGGGRSAPDARSDADQLVKTVRELSPEQA